MPRPVPQEWEDAENVASRGQKADTRALGGSRTCSCAASLRQGDDAIDGRTHSVLLSRNLAVVTEMQEEMREALLVTTVLALVFLLGAVACAKLVFLVTMLLALSFLVAMLFALVRRCRPRQWHEPSWFFYNVDSLRAFPVHVGHDGMSTGPPDDAPRACPGSVSMPMSKAGFTGDTAHHATSIDDAARAGSRKPGSAGHGAPRTLVGSGMRPASSHGGEVSCVAVSADSRSRRV